MNDEKVYQDLNSVGNFGLHTSIGIIENGELVSEKENCDLEEKLEEEFNMVEKKEILDVTDNENFANEEEEIIHLCDNIEVMVDLDKDEMETIELEEKRENI